LSVARQCEPPGLARSSWYCQSVGESAEALALLRLLDEQYTRAPFGGVRRMTAWLRGRGHVVNRKRVRRLLRLLGVEAIYPKPSMSAAATGHRIYPYLLRGVPITHADQVWSSDMTYSRLERGWACLVAILDWYSRYMAAWEVSNALDSYSCIAALDRSLARGRLTIFNADHGSQFTSHALTRRLRAAEIQICMDGRGRALDEDVVERLWRSVEYEEVSLKDCPPPPRRSMAWPAASASTTRSGLTRPWPIAPRRPSTTPTGRSLRRFDRFQSTSTYQQSRPNSPDPNVVRPGSCLDNGSTLQDPRTLMGEILATIASRGDERRCPGRTGEVAAHGRLVRPDCRSRSQIDPVGPRWIKPRLALTRSCVEQSGNRPYSGHRALRMRAARFVTC
jgi:putative transposase